MRNLFFIAIIVFSLALTFVCCLGKRLRRRRRFAAVVCSLALAVVAVWRWASPHWDYPETTGTYKVATLDRIYTDYGRVEPYENDGSPRWLHVALWYPERYSGGDHTCPVVVFSHGSFGVKESNVSLYRELASHGYVVCSIDHTYQCLVAIDSTGRRTGMDKGYRNQVLRASDSTEKNRAELLGLFHEWMSVRMRDMGFVIDAIKTRAMANDPGDGGAYLLADTAKIGVMGHSIGGSAALGIGRSRSDIAGVIALEAPFMYDAEGIGEGGFIFNDEPYPVPLLSVYTDSSWKIIAKSPQYAQNHAILNDACDWTEDVYIEGAGHMTLTDLAYSDPPLCLIFGQDLFFDVDGYVREANRRYLDFFDRCFKEKSV